MNFKYIVTPKPHMVGKSLKMFYRDLLGQYLLPANWRDRPKIEVTITKKVTRTCRVFFNGEFRR